jgi:hypothetical protein
MLIKHCRGNFRKHTRTHAYIQCGSKRFICTHKSIYHLTLGGQFTLVCGVPWCVLLRFLAAMLYSKWTNPSTSWVHHTSQENGVLLYLSCIEIKYIMCTLWTDESTLPHAVWMLWTPFIWNKKKVVSSRSGASLVPHVTFIWLEVLIMSSKWLSHCMSTFVVFTTLCPLLLQDKNLDRTHQTRWKSI